MKSRAGVVGRHLGADVLPKLSTPAHVRLHLIGHSFGARLVIAAASALPSAVPLYSLTLLQGAFSHNAMAALVRPGLPGAFANVVGRPTGPIAITHTHNDEACTFWYAIASRLSRDMAKAISDKDDAFGAMGANGAQKLNPEVLAQDVSDLNFRPVAGKVNRFLADSYVVKTDTLDAHNNVTNPTVGRLVASVLDMPAA
jgi:pimeloyl-ACP methyl ester carboxylesterase